MELPRFENEESKETKEGGEVVEIQILGKQYEVEREWLDKRTKELFPEFFPNFTPNPTGVGFFIRQQIANEIYENLKAPSEGAIDESSWKMIVKIVDEKVRELMPKKTETETEPEEND